MSIAIRFRYSEDARLIINKIAVEYPETTMVFGVPLFLLIIFSLISGALWYYGSNLYKIDLDIVYGPSFKKLDELVAEMEVLRKQD